ncbi:hypothetical protein SAMN05660649_02816 [Desulfotomaculum arcticum]|uniref:DUF1573 domain-containing protein n=1 Tax=Desulfotruncus arcticus DSM 17038 TaxID=1121424 RepID=A0A1I2UZ96_9FIRM|nr:hypothetical protein [Desulfotruncus arcticus]SFG82464.1 hypothetical protein SAMN05660649_02816 [Desulfotomaculum arcticum] [Desulfotruncus arcticus DSM 17038]
MLQGNDKGYLRLALGVGVLVVLAAGMLFGVWGYTSAQVKNEAGLTIVDSKEALIAVDIPPSLSITQGFSDSCGTITNNKSEIVEITVVGTGEFDVDDLYLSPGDSTDLKIAIPGAEEPGLHNYRGTVTAEWDGGQAEINFDVEVYVEAIEGEGP